MIEKKEVVMKEVISTKERGQLKRTYKPFKTDREVYITFSRS